MGRSARVVDRSTLLREAADTGETIFRNVAELEAEADTVSLQGSPINPLYINEADSLLFMTTTRTGMLLYGRTRGSGFIISRLPSSHPSLIRWSAPLFVAISLRSWGLSLGRQRTQHFVSCMRSDLRTKLCSAEHRRMVVGLEASLSFGGLQHKTDLIALTSDDVGTVGINATSGTLLDLSFVSGAMRVDSAANEVAYGAGVAPLSVLRGGVDAPREMSPLFSALNSVVGTVERVTPPARVSASLERYTAGFDPERTMVLPNGVVVREDLQEPPKEDFSFPLGRSSGLGGGGGTDGGGGTALGRPPKAPAVKKEE